jgi:hypothetical protein
MRIYGNGAKSGLLPPDQVTSGVSWIHARIKKAVMDCFSGVSRACLIGVSKTDYSQSLKERWLIQSSYSWHKAMLRKSLTEIFEDRSLDALIESGILPEGEYQSLLKDFWTLYKEIGVNYANQVEQANTRYIESKKSIEDAFSAEIDQLNRTLVVLRVQNAVIEQEINFLVSFRSHCEKTGVDFSFDDKPRLISLKENLERNKRAILEAEGSEVEIRGRLDLSLSDPQVEKEKALIEAERQKTDAYGTLNERHKILRAGLIVLGQYYPVR